MKELTISQHIVEINIHDPQGEIQTKYAVFFNVLEGVRATFLCDIYLWLNSLPPEITEQWKGLPVFIYFIGGKGFPKYFPLSAKGYSGTIHLVNVDDGKEGE